MDFVRRTALTPSEISEIEQLANLCYTHDGLPVLIKWNALANRNGNDTSDYLCYEDGQLIGVLNLYVFNSKEAEVSGMVHPLFRRKGIFKTFVEFAKEDCLKRNLKAQLFITESQSVSGRAFLNDLGATHEITEYKMVLDETKEQHQTTSQIILRPAIVEDSIYRKEILENSFHFTIEDHNSLNQDLTRPNVSTYVGEIDGKVIGNVSVTNAHDELFIYGLCIHPDFRSKGYGKGLLIKLVDILKNIPHEAIVLEVASLNEGALKMYKDAHFDVVSSYDYYRLKIHS